MNPFIFSPDDTTTGGAATAAPADTHTRHEGNVPRQDAVLLSVAQLAGAKWAASPFVTLLWKTQAAFAQDTANFATALSDRNTAGGSRPAVTKDLENLDSAIDDAIPFVKGYVSYKWGPKDAAAHYAAFGIAHSAAHGYEFPQDRQGRLQALQMMVQAIGSNGFGSNDYGTVFWTDIATRYAAATNNASAGTGNISEQVGKLTLLRTTLRRVLHSILLILEANYPDTFVQARCDWGFQKENY